MFEHNEISFTSFCYGVYGTTGAPESIDAFNRELVEKFSREVSYRLDEILEDTRDEQEVTADAMLVFQHHDHSVTIHGNVQGSIVATGGSRVSGSSAQYESKEDLKSTLGALEPLLRGISSDHRQVTEQALQILAKSIDDDSVTAEEVSGAVKTIAANSPTMAERLKSIAEKVGVSLAATSLIAGIKLAWSHLPGLPSH